MNSHSYSEEQSALADLPPRKREDIIRASIAEAYRKLEPEVKEKIDEGVVMLDSIYEGKNLGRAGWLELLAKLGMYMNKADGL